MDHEPANLIVEAAAIAIIACGGIWGTMAALKNTRGVQERAFVIRVCIMCWLGYLFSVVGLLFIPPPWKFGIAALYVLQILRSFLRWKKRRADLRVEDATEKK